MKAETTPKQSESTQSSTMETVLRGKLNKQLLPGEQTRSDSASCSVRLQSTCQDAGSLDTMFTSLTGTAGASSQTLAEAEAETDAGTSETLSLHCACSSGCASSSSHHISSSLFQGQSRSSTPSTMVCDPATCPIIPGCETTIDISKGRTGLGLSIVGGCDTLLVKKIIMLEFDT